MEKKHLWLIVYALGALLFIYGTFFYISKSIISERPFALEQTITVEKGTWKVCTFYQKKLLSCNLKIKVLKLVEDQGVPCWEFKASKKAVYTFKLSGKYDCKKDINTIDKFDIYTE